MNAIQTICHYFETPRKIGISFREKGTKIVFWLLLKELRFFIQNEIDLFQKLKNYLQASKTAKGLKMNKIFE